MTYILMNIKSLILDSTENLDLTLIQNVQLNL
jgi:hypothetical protein